MERGGGGALKSKAEHTSHYEPGLAVKGNGITLGVLREGARGVGMLCMGTGRNLGGCVCEHVFGVRCCLQIQRSVSQCKRGITTSPVTLAILTIQTARIAPLNVRI